MGRASDIQNWNLTPYAPAAPAAAPAATAYGTQTNRAPMGASGGLLSNTPMPRPPGFLESTLFSGIPGYTQRRYQDRLARWRQNAEAQVTQQAQARMQGLMNPSGNLMMQPQSGGLIGPAQQQMQAQVMAMTPRQQQAVQAQYRAQGYDQLGMPLLAQEERNKSSALAQESYQYQREQGRLDKAEARATQKDKLTIENTIRGNPQKEIASPQMAVTQVRMAAEEVEAAGGPEQMTGADDEVLMTRFAKAMRPNEALMSDDAARISAASTSGHYKQMWNNLTKTGTLLPEQRREILSAMQNIGASQYKELQRVQGDMERQAKRYGVPMRAPIPGPNPQRPAYNDPSKQPGFVAD